jgi:hypothetical protein
MSEINEQSFPATKLVEVPVKVGDHIWFISDDELTGGMAFEGDVTSITLTSVKIDVEGPLGGEWNIPLDWFSDDKAFTSELDFVSSCGRTWMTTALTEKRDHDNLKKVHSATVSENFRLKRLLTDAGIEF